MLLYLPTIWRIRISARHCLVTWVGIRFGVFSHQQESNILTILPSCPGRSDANKRSLRSTIKLWIFLRLSYGMLTLTVLSTVCVIVFQEQVRKQSDASQLHSLRQTDNLFCRSEVSGRIIHGTQLSTKLESRESLHLLFLKGSRDTTHRLALHSPGTLWCASYAAYVRLHPT